MRLIVNADDFGYSRGQNYGIIDAYENGIVRSASLMAAGGAADHAVQLAKENPGLGVGVHLVLDFGKPVLSPSRVPSLTGEDGSFIRFPFDTALEVNTAEVEEEWRAQIKSVLGMGIQPTHLDGHHHFHLHPQLLTITCRLAREFGLPIRPLPAGWDTVPYAQVSAEMETVKHPDACVTDFYAAGVKEEFFPEYFAAHPEFQDKTVELMCHPAYVDDVIIAGSSYNFPRAMELLVLKSASVGEWVKLNGVELVNYSQL